MVAPQVSGWNNDNKSTWKIVKTKKQLKEEKKWKNNKSFPPLPALSSAIEHAYKSDDDTKSSKSTKSFTTPNNKPSIKLRKVTPDIDNIEIVNAKSEDKDKEEDDMSTVSSSSNEGFFSSSDSDDSMKKSRTAYRILRKQEKLKKKKLKDMELDKIIERIENEHISIEESQPKDSKEVKIKQEQDTDQSEFAFSAKLIPNVRTENNNLLQVNDNHDRQELNTLAPQDNIDQEHLLNIKKEIDMLYEIETNKDSVSFYVKEEDTSHQDSLMLEIAMDMSHIKDNTDYTNHIKEKLPRLHDQIIPSSLREIAFLGPMLHTSISDWSVDSLERGVELERIEKSMFFHQLKLHGMDHSFKKLYEELNTMWDEYGIPYNKRKKLLLVEIEMVSLLMCDVLPSNYSEQGIWVNDESQGQYYQFFKDKNVDTGRKKWLDLIGYTTYKWFWNVYSNLISLSTLNDEEIVMLDDLFEIVTFVHPPAVQFLLNNPPMLRKFIFIREKAKMKSLWVDTRHHLYYIWHFFGFRILPNSYPSYDSNKTNSIFNTTRWISKLMTLFDFFNEYQHFYLVDEKKEENQYLLYESPPTYTCNWQWEADPDKFYEETKIYNGVRAANLSTICCLPKIKQQSRQTMSKLIQSVLLRGKHNRMYHYDFTQKFPGKPYHQSVELPIDWLIYYDSLSRVSRNPTELYSYKLFSVSYLILLDRTKRESHHYHATKDYTTEELIPSERLQITCCHSANTTLTTTNKTMIRRNIFLPNIRSPFILNYSPTEITNIHHLNLQEKPIPTFMVQIILYRTSPT